MKTLAVIILSTMLLFVGVSAFAQEPPVMQLWQGKETNCSLILPRDTRAATLGESTINYYLRKFFNVSLPVSDGDSPGNYIVLGTPANNPTLARLVDGGLKLTTSDIGEEGFQLLTHARDESRYVIIYGNTPQALKYGCQEFIFYHLQATETEAVAEWPLYLMMKPEFPYRGIYMLPCWAHHDTMQSWRRVLRFNSELTINRNWFWLAGFPVAGNTGEYGGVPLAQDENIQSLIDLVNADGMKFYIGGGWLSWHHANAVGSDPVKGMEYYLNYLKTFKGVSGFYFEPFGEGRSERYGNWRPAYEGLRTLIDKVLKDDPDFEVAVAIGKRNPKEYLEMMAELDPERVFWWWCWGNPHEDNPWRYYPSICEWHTTWVHGGAEPPHTAMMEEKMVGQVTSYDPGMGFGNPWNGWAAMGGLKGPRDFDPYTMPYFSHEYRYRERCWNLHITDDEFKRRLSKRLFDTNLLGCIGPYMDLANMCWAPEQADEEKLANAEALIRQYLDKGTPRNRDTFRRMSEAAENIRKIKARSENKD